MSYPTHSNFGRINTWPVAVLIMGLGMAVACGGPPEEERRDPPVHEPYEPPPKQEPGGEPGEPGEEPAAPEAPPEPGTAPESAYTGAGGELRTGPVPTPAGPMTFTYRVVDGKAIIDGDIVMDLSQLEALELQLKQGPGQGIAAIKDRTRRWPGGVIPFTVATNLPNQARVTNSVATWNNTSVIKLVQRTTEPNWVTFRRGGANTGCSSDNIGMAGGQQFVTLDGTCTTGNVRHEIGHVVGLFHEHTRADRDNFVTYTSGNVDTASFGFDPRPQFNKYAAGTGIDYGPYDHGSVMHYPANAFARTGTNTLASTVALPAGVAMGQRGALSPLDIRGVSWMYGARGTAKVQIVVNYSGKCLDIPYGARGNGIRPQQYTCHSGDAQRWTLLRDSDGYFEIRNEASGMCLDLPGGWSGSVYAQQFRCHGGPNQKFRLHNIPGGTYSRGLTQIQSTRHSNQCLDIQSNGQLRFGPCNSGYRNVFKLYAHPRDRDHQLVQTQSGWCADIPWAWMGDNMPAQIHPCKANRGGGNQDFRFVPTGDGRHYLVRAAHSNKCLEQQTPTYSSSTRWVQKTCNTNKNEQRFRLRVMTNGTYQLIPRYSWSGTSCVRRQTSSSYYLKAMSCHSGHSDGYFHVE